jgi:hypothetical protein
MSDRRKQPSRDDLTDAARFLREMLKAIPSDEDSRRDAVVRRRVEGAIAAAELAAGEDPPRSSDSP